MDATPFRHSTSTASSFFPRHGVHGCHRRTVRWCRHQQLRPRRHLVVPPSILHHLEVDATFYSNGTTRFSRHGSNDGRYCTLRRRRTVQNGNVPCNNNRQRYVVHSQRLPTRSRRLRMCTVSSRVLQRQRCKATSFHHRVHNVHFMPFQHNNRNNRSSFHQRMSCLLRKQHTNKLQLMFCGSVSRQLYTRMDVPWIIRISMWISMSW